MPGSLELGERTRAAVADAWQAEGLLREPLGGAVAELRDVSLMASGLPHAQWNNADVIGPEPDIGGALAFYAERGLPWSIRVAAGMPCAHGRYVMRQRLMALRAPSFRPGPHIPALGLAPAGPNELESVVDIDSAAFEEDPEIDRLWIEPHFGAARVETALGALNGRPLATGYTLRTDAWAGPALHLGGVAVLEQGRRRGVASALASWLLGRGFAAGAELAHLHAESEASARVFARLGFEDAGELDVYAER